MPDLPLKRLGGLAYVEAGSGPVMVLCHGGAGSHTHWARNIDALARHFKVRAVDLPGFGESDRVDKGMSLDDYVSLAEAKVSSVAGDAPFHLVGFSFGAVLSSALAVAFGRRVVRLSLCGPGGFGRMDRPPIDVRSPPKGPLDDPDVRTAIRHNLLALMLADPESIDEATLELQYANGRRTAFDSRQLSLTRRLLENLPRIAAPVQVIWGARDQLAYPSVEGRAAMARAARADLRIDLVPAAGHWVQYEAADAVNRLLLDFRNVEWN